MALHPSFALLRHLNSTKFYMRTYNLKIAMINNFAFHKRPVHYNYSCNLMEFSYFARLPYLAIDKAKLF